MEESIKVSYCHLSILVWFDSFRRFKLLRKASYLSYLKNLLIGNIYFVKKKIIITLSTTIITIFFISITMHT